MIINECRFSGEYHIHHVFCQDHHHNLRLRISWLSMKWWLPPFPCFWNEFLWQHFKLSLLSQLFKTSPRLVLSASLIRWTRKDVDVAWFQSFFKEALHERSHHLHKCLNFGHPNLGDVLKTWSHFKKSPRQRAVRKKILLRWDLDLPIFHRGRLRLFSSLSDRTDQDISMIQPYLYFVSLVSVETLSLVYWVKISVELE